MAIKKKVTKKPEKAVVYIGPTIGSGVLVRYAVFLGGEFPPHIEEMRAKSEALRGLFVPISQLSEARQRIDVKGDILNVYLNQLKAEL